MDQDKRMIANRRNALASTGPRTPEGKALSSMNAVRHGVTAHTDVLPGESAEELAELKNAVCAQLKPASALESALVAQVVSLLWRLSRVSRAETGVLLSYMNDLEIARAEATMRAASRVVTPFDDMLLQPTVVVQDARLHAAGSDAADRAGQMQLTPPAVLGLAYRKDASSDDVLFRLQRYEGSLRKSLSRALADLRYLRDA